MDMAITWLYMQCWANDLLYCTVLYCTCTMAYGTRLRVCNVTCAGAWRGVTCLETDWVFVDEVARGKHKSADDLEHIEHLTRARRHRAHAEERGGHLRWYGDRDLMPAEQLAQQFALPVGHDRRWLAVRVEDVGYFILHLRVCVNEHIKTWCS